MPFTRNLAILHTPMNEDVSDWLTVRDRIARRAPDIDVRVLPNHAADPEAARWQVSRPSLVFSVCPLWLYRPEGGRIYAGQAMSKLEENDWLERAGVPTPKAVRLRRDMSLDPAEWGEHVVVKPSRGSFGRDVHLVPTRELADRYDTIVDPKEGMSLVQPFVEHVDAEGRPTTHRVLTLFGKALYALRSSWREARGSIADIAKSGGLIAANTGEKDRIRALLDDAELVALAERAAAAVPAVPVLGVDVIRETGTGKLFVLELNASGTVWHLSSQTGKDRYDEAFRRALYAQFNALDRTAELLLERVRMEAR